MNKTLALMVVAMITVAIYFFVKDEAGFHGREGRKNLEIREVNNHTTKNIVRGSSSSATQKLAHKENLISKKVTSDGSTLPSSKEVFSIYQPPMKGLADEVESIMASIDKDASGDAEFSLSRIAEHCEMAPKTEVELRDLKSIYEDASLMSGQNNGHVMENISRAEVHFNECQSLQSMGMLESYDYLEVSALKGNAVAKTVLATAVEPKDFSNWSPDRKNAYQERMESFLKEARAECEPRAFYSFAYGVGEGEVWVDRSNVAGDVRKYANLLARGMIYKNKTGDSERMLNTTYAKLNSLGARMDEQSIIEADMYGRRLYKEACE